MSEELSRQRRFDITLAGETNLDLILYGLPEAMQVERELLARGFTATLGGSSSILAHNLGVLGCKVGFETELGDDPLGRVALGFLEESGIDLSRLRHKSEATTGVTVLLPHGSRRHILTYPGVMTEITTDDVDLEYLADSRHFHLSSLFLQTGMHADLPRLFADLKQRGLTLSLDTNDDPADRWGGVLDELLGLVDILLPNEDELLRITGQDTLEAALDKISERVPLVVVKLGRRGAVVQQGRQRSWVDPLIVEPVDTIGAGDSFNAGFLYAHLQGDSAVDAAAFGNATGALSTLRAGGVQAFRERALREDFLARYRPAHANGCA